MRKVLLLLAAVLVLGCKESAVRPYQAMASITGYDMRECASPACGGLLLTINNDTAKNPPSFYHTRQTLTQLGLSGNSKLPISVNIDYKPDTGIFAEFHYIVITHLKVVN
ncbi:MAG TPA: hypothetical protein VHE59_15170 [Mucilaginibacter sp.]|nr:hypothetical protein [Mucilaginibacter sp.]